jgi:hypothetical protein
MADPVSPSPALGTFTRAVEQQFPPEQRSRLVAHHEAISHTTDRHDGRRARHCALWAIRLADDKGQSHPRWRAIQELHQIWKDFWFAVDFGVMTPVSGQRGHPGRDVEIQWIEDAVAVAKNVGETDGWDHAPWEDLLVSLIDMEGDDTGTDNR